MKLWKSTVLVTSILFVSGGIAQAEIAVATRWKPMSLDYNQCIVNARNVLRVVKFEEQLNNDEGADNSGSGSAWATREAGEYKGVIRCLPNQEIVFLVVAGPSKDKVKEYANKLLNGFTSR
jgi:hypothetical protein